MASHLSSVRENGRPVRVSVIIPARNEQSVLPLCLESLMRNRSSYQEFEVIVVDNGSQDRTVESAKHFQSKLPLTIAALANVHISAVRNYGASVATGDYLAFLDADCVAPPNWVANLARVLDLTGPGIVGASYQIPADATWVGRLWCEDRFSDRAGAVSYVPAGDLILPRKLFLSLGGFDESIQTNEDLELCRRAAHAGYAVNSYPELRVVHLGTPRTLLGFYRKQRWHGTHVFSVFLRDPQKRLNRRPVMVSLYTVFCGLWLSVGCFWGLWNGVWLWALLALAFWICPFLALCCARAIPRQKWQEIPALTVLYLAFALARAESIIRFWNWSGSFRKNVTRAPT